MSSLESSFTDATQGVEREPVADPFEAGSSEAGQTVTAGGIATAGPAR